MKHYAALKNRETKLSVIGLGYVGLPIAAAFSKKVPVIGFDTNQKKIEVYRQGEDPTREVGDEAVRNCSVDFTGDEKGWGKRVSISSLCPLRSGVIKHRIFLW